MAKYHPGGTKDGCCPVYARGQSPKDCLKCGVYTSKEVKYNYGADLLQITCSWCGFYWFEVCADYRVVPAQPSPLTIDEAAAREVELLLGEHSQ